MGGAEFLLAINFSIGALLAAAFMTIAIYDPTRRAARWFAGAYFAGAAYFAVEFLIPIMVGGLRIVNVGYAIFMAAIVLMNAGLARLYHVRHPWAAVLFFCGLFLAIKMASDLLPRESFLRMTIYQAPYFALQAFGATLILRSHRKGRLDLLFAFLMMLGAVHYIMKPFLAAVTGGIGDSPAAYSSTLYAFIGQSAGAVLFVAAALLLLVILVRDLLNEITERSETDVLSGLFNRRGFEDRLAVRLRENRHRGVPLSLVLCDLDHFKTVNDTYGHGGGDRVIAAFAGILRDATRYGDHVVARVGGEEFAVLLPGCNLSAARLFAEGVRQSMRGLRVEGLPDTLTVSASFGVAEWQPPEAGQSLHLRADGALYAAKDAGRDCVKVAETNGKMVDRGAITSGPAARSS